MENCPCGSGFQYSECCEPYLSGKKDAPTAEALMRSRYAAYVVQAIDYIIDTCIQGDRINREKTEEWSRKSKWLGLKIISVSGGHEDDGSGTVVFEATYELKGLRYVHHEIAIFRKRDDRWYYSDGTIEPQQVIRNGTKTGRNDPCVCGSGKKYKNCCGR